MSYRILEVYESVHGEFPYLGKPCTIVRFAGCNLHCPYCDAPHGEGVEVEPQELYDKIASYGNFQVLVTGGEPLIQPGINAFLQKLSFDLNLDVIIETNGTIALDKSLPYVADAIVMDVKLFKESHVIESNNLQYLQHPDTIKFVHSSEKELDLARNFLMFNEHKIDRLNPPMIVFSPVLPGEVFFDKIMEIMKTYPQWDVRLQCQIHKVLGLG